MSPHEGAHRDSVDRDSEEKAPVTGVEAPFDPHLSDLGLVVVANVLNLLVLGIMLSRPLGLVQLENALGFATPILALPAGFFMIMNAAGRREWWTIVLPALLVSYLVVHFLLDDLLVPDFRMTALLGPYLLLFYVAVMGMIGYAFLVDKRYGVVTLITYFLSLAATGYSLSQVGY